ncbi:pyridoxamine 5'-phosphate oxidase family protein [Jatrophihabitans sp. DSM 45814]
MSQTQRRGRSIAMDENELNDFLGQERVCRVASVTIDGPHVSPLWFVWDGTSLWLHSVVKSQRWRDLERDPRIAAVIDGGEAYGELRGVELRGSVVVVGDVPRVGGDSAELEPVEALWSAKYSGGAAMTYDANHAWLRLTPAKVTSWDFRKFAAAAAARAARTT